MIPLYDAHNHLQDEWLLPHRDVVFADLAKAGVRRVVVNGTSESDWPDVAALGAAQSIVLPSFGLHPWDVGNASSSWRDRLEAQLSANPSAAIGEIGLDRWMLDSAKPDDPRLTGLRRASIEAQRAAFVWQLERAARENRPASIHCLEAFGLMLETLQSTARPERGFLLHAFSGSVEMVKNFARLGAYFSFNGSFLDPRKQRLRAVYEAVPLDRLLVETDAPAMRLPAPLEKYPALTAPTGQLANHPANITATYVGLSEWRGLDVPGLAARVEENFRRLFG
jgi:TatD DNase family protein